jgi:secreted protein with Ig-like and vWFA domain
MFHFAAPQWFLLLPAVALLGGVVSRAELWRPLRAITLILLVMVLARPEVRRTGAGLDLWVLLDRSLSAQDALEPRRAEIERLLERGRGADDRVRFVDFAAAPVQRGAALAFEAPTVETRLRLATEFALAQRDPGRSSRLLAVTDGQSTEDLGGLAGKLREAGVAMDLRLVGENAAADVRLGRLIAPDRVRPGEGFLLEAEVQGTGDTAIPYEVWCDGESAGAGTVTLRNGRGTLRVAARSVAPGARKYEIRLLAPGDPRPGNNVSWGWVEVSEGQSVLLVSAYADDPLAAALRAQGVRVELVTDTPRLHPGMLAGARAVVFNNVPAHRVPAEFLAAMEFFVTAQGGGLLMAGGRFSFGAGGYFESPLDPLLPVSMELRQEHRKLAVAMVLVLDRSGSMAAAVGAGTTKMDLANEGAARSVELLGPSDAVAVFAVDSEPHAVVSLTKIGGDVERITRTVRRIESAGGGIYVFTGLRAAWEELKKSPAGQRHVVLFADAADAEEPGDYQALLAEMTAEGATVSVIGLGSETDSDAAFLKDVAARGNGRIFFNADPAQLPALFAQETVAVARSAFLRTPVPVVDAAGWLEIAARPLAWPAQVDGYNLSYLRPEATAAALSGDEYRAPLVAFWQRGAGRAAAVSFPLAGEFSESVRAWPELADFERTLLRWLLPEAPPPGAGLRTRTVGGDLVVELLHDDTWTARLAADPPRLLLAEGVSGRTFEVPWEKIAPGRFQARVALPAGNWLRGVVQAGRERWPFGPVSPGLDPEWSISPERVADLRAVSTASGGREIHDLRDVWKAPRPAAFSPLGSWLLLGVLLTFLADCALTRWRGGSAAGKERVAGAVVR